MNSAWSGRRTDAAEDRSACQAREHPLAQPRAAVVGAVLRPEAGAPPSNFWGVAGDLLARLRPLAGDDLGHSVAWRQPVDLAGQPVVLGSAIRSGSPYSLASRSLADNRGAADP